MKKNSDLEIIAEWQYFLKTFKEIDHKKEGAENEYQDLKALVKSSAILTPRQTEMFVYRCDNYKAYYAPKSINSQVKEDKK